MLSPPATAGGSDLYGVRWLIVEERAAEELLAGERGLEAVEDEPDAERGGEGREAGVPRAEVRRDGVEAEEEQEELHKDERQHPETQQHEERHGRGRHAERRVEKKGAVPDGEASDEQPEQRDAHALAPRDDGQQEQQEHQHRREQERAERLPH